MTTGDNQDWRGGRSQRNAPHSEKAVPSWKQSRATTGSAAAKSPGGWKRKLRILMVSGFLATLVAVAIYLFWPTRALKTHFVLLNLRSVSSDFDTAAAFRLPPELANESNNTARRVVTLSEPESLGLLQPNDKQSLSNLTNAHVAVIYLQTTLVAAPDGTFRCLLRNSTPNLNTNEYADLRTLRDAIKEASKKDADKHWLLLVDQILPGHEWRTGILPTDLDKEFESWTLDIPQLVVMLSSNRTDGSEPGTPGTNGQTVFGYFATLGLSQLATRDPKGDITANDFCRYVREKTNLWVRSHRNLAGQSVSVFPSGNQRNFVMIRNSVARPLTAEDINVAGKQDSQQTKQINDLWSLRESLRKNGGAIWSPVLWRGASQELKHAERSMLRGLAAEADESLLRAKKSFKNLDDELRAICPGDTDFQPERGFFRQLYSGLPAAHRVESLFPESSAEVPAGDVKLIEDVIAGHLKPFVALSGVGEAQIEGTCRRRRIAEEAIAQLFHCSSSLQKTIPALERSLLLLEDRRFTRMSAAVAEEQLREEQRIDETLTVVSQYAEAHDVAETVLRNALDGIQDLAQWSAHCECGDSASDQTVWREVLVANSSESHLDPERIRNLLDRLNIPVADESTDLPELARKLRREVFRLCGGARGLKAALEIREPEIGYDGPGLKKVTDELSMWSTHASTALADSLEAAEKLCKSAADEEPALRSEQVRVYRMLLTTLDLSCVSAATHNKVLERLQKWNLTWAGAPQTKPEDEPADSNSSISTRSDLEALWLKQVLDLMPVSDNQAAQLKHMNGLIDSLTSADAPPGLTGELGDAVRKLWIANQQSAAVAAKSTAADAFSQLHAADLQSRLFAGFDTKKSNVSVSARMRQLAKLHYCMMQADRLVAGLWIESDEQAPLNQNGWFAKVATRWLDAATAVSDDAKLSSEMPPAINSALDDLRDRLRTSDDLKFLPAFSRTNLVDLGDESLTSVPVHMDVSETAPGPVSGAASLLIRLTQENGMNVMLGIDENAVPIVVGKGGSHAELQVRRLRVPDTNEACKPFELQPEVFFRGRSWKTAQSLLVSTCAAGEYIADILPRADTASISVTGDDPRPVILILDFSDSMKRKLSDGTPRFEAAIATLKTLIQKDDLRDARVTLKVYGHRVQWDPTAQIHRPNPRYEKAFPDRPIPKTLDTHNDIENIFEGVLRADDANAKDAFLKILDLLRASGHWGSTPLIESLRDSISTDLGPNSGIVVAITDGAPTDDGDGPREPDRTRALRVALDSNPGTSINVVAFDIDKDPGERSRLTTTFDKFGGRVSIVDASNEAGLREKIQESLDPRKFTVAWDADTRSREVELGNSATELLPGSDYFVRFGNNIAAGPLALNPGDALQLNLLLKEKRFRVFRLPGRAPGKAESKPASNEEPWMIKSIDGVQTSDIPGEDASLFAKAVLRLMLDHEDDGRIVRQPAEIEFYLRDQDSTNRPRHLSQRYDSRCGAPAWEFTIDRWRKGKSCLVDAIWKMERSVPERLIDWETLKNADSPANSIRIDDNSTGLPPGKTWITLRGQELQVRIDSVVGEPESDTNRLTDVRIELGQPDTQEQARTFLPWELNTSIIRTERGSVIYKFSGDRINPDNLKRAKIAFTSYANRRNGATVIQNFRIQY